MILRQGVTIGGNFRANNARKHKCLFFVKIIIIPLYFYDFVESCVESYLEHLPSFACSRISRQELKPIQGCRHQSKRFLG